MLPAQLRVRPASTAKEQPLTEKGKEAPSAATTIADESETTSGSEAATLAEHAHHQAETIKVDGSEEEDGEEGICLEVVNESEHAVAPFVFLETERRGRFSDNGFLLLPRTVRRIQFYPSSAPQDEKSALSKQLAHEKASKLATSCRVTSLRDSYTH